MRRITRNHPLGRTWTPYEVSLLGHQSDADVASELGISRLTVYRERLRRKIKPANPKNRPKKTRGT